MSAALEHLVWEKNTDLSGNDLLVMLALAWWADDDGVAWPAVKSIADRTKVSERTVQYILRKLADQGYIRIEQGRGRTHTSNYHIIPERFEACEKVQLSLHLLNKEGSQEKVQNTTQKVQSEAEKVQNPVLKGAIAIAPERQGKTKEKQKRQGERAREVQPQLFRPVPKAESARPAIPLPPMPGRPHTFSASFFDARDQIAWAEHEAETHDVALSIPLFVKQFTNHYTLGRGRAERLTDEEWEGKWRQWVLSELGELASKGRTRTRQQGATNGKDKRESAITNAFEEAFGVDLDTAFGGGRARKNADYQTGVIRQLPSPKPQAG